MGGKTDGGRRPGIEVMTEIGMYQSIAYRIIRNQLLPKTLVTFSILIEIRPSGQRYFIMQWYDIDLQITKALWTDYPKDRLADRQTLLKRFNKRLPNFQLILWRKVRWQRHARPADVSLVEPAAEYAFKIAAKLVKTTG